jgi:hypothetical protein
VCQRRRVRVERGTTHQSPAGRRKWQVALTLCDLLLVTRHLKRHRLEGPDAFGHRRVRGPEIGPAAFRVVQFAAERIGDAQVGRATFDRGRGFDGVLDLFERAGLKASGPSTSRRWRPPDTPAGATRPSPASPGRGWRQHHRHQPDHEKDDRQRHRCLLVFAARAREPPPPNRIIRPVQSPAGPASDQCRHDRHHECRDCARAISVRDHALKRS